MKFNCSVDINVPLDKTIELWSNPELLGKWQPGFESYTHLSGEPGTVGAKAKMVYQNKNNTIELIETIKVNNLPEEFTGWYEHIHMDNSMKNHFKALSDNSCRWECEIDYTFKSFMIKIMGFLMPGMFKKQTQTFLDAFKVFAEETYKS